MVGNLLSNAIKFSDLSSTIVISVSREYNPSTDTDMIRFAVKDQGVGMSEEDQKSLFQPFMQIRPGELQKGRGSGLGLSICQNIIKLHSGTIGCNSKIRQGKDLESG